MTDEPVDRPLRGATAEENGRFSDGDRLFDTVFHDADGLGPLYIRTSCSSCHSGAMRGPGGTTKMAVFGPDGPSSDQSLLAYGHTVRPYLTAGATTPIVAPEDPSVRTRLRLGPAVFGRGYMEAVADEEIERVEAEQSHRTDGVSGRINRVTFRSEANPDSTFHQHHRGETELIGRFGFKARDVTVDDFVADALQGDMGLTTPLRPEELPNPDGLTDDLKPGVDLKAETVNALANYVRLLEIPKRRDTGSHGRELFAQVGCATCHVPSLRTRSDYPIKALAGIDAPVYTDFLLHDLGDESDDGVAEEGATSREWRTAPLIGLRHLRAYLHDGRARTIEAAIAGHFGTGSEASSWVGAYGALSEEDRQALLDFVSSL